MIKWSRRAFKALKSLSKSDQVRIVQAVEKLPNGDVKALKGGLKGLYRLRVGDWRVIFEKTEYGFLIHDVLHRRDAYR